MLDVFIFTDIEMPFTGTEMTHSVGECSITDEQDCAACSYEIVLKTVANSNAELVMTQKIQRGRLFLRVKRTWTTKNITSDCRSWSYKILVKPKEIVTKNMSGNPDSANNSLAHPEETLDNETLQATTHSDNDDGGQAKAQIELTCSVSQAERILNMCEIDYEIHISPNSSFKFGGIISI